MLSRLLLRSRKFINTQLIKQDVEKRLRKSGNDALQEYPKTFEQKIILLNDPRTIQKLEIVQFGVKFKPGKKYLALLLSLSALFFYYNQQRLPEKVIDRYFSISNSSSTEYWSGFLLAPLMYEQPFYYYLPLLPVVHQLSRFVGPKWLISLTVSNLIINGCLGKYLVDERVKKYEVWDQERVSYGEGTLLSLAMMLWGALGPSGGFTALKSRLFLKSVPGLGITRAGIPIGYICLFYIFFELYLSQKEKKNSELMGVSAVTGVLAGLLLRRFSPLK